MRPPDESTACVVVMKKLAPLAEAESPSVSSPPSPLLSRATFTKSPLLTENLAAAALELEQPTSLRLSSVGANVDNPCPHVQRKPVVGGRVASRQGDHYVFVMVGLPGSGKSHLVRKLRNYLAFFHGVSLRAFSAGDYRRRRMGHHAAAAFFDPTDAAAVAERRSCSFDALRDLKAWVIGAIDPDGRQARSSSSSSSDGASERFDPSNATYTTDSKVRFAVFDATNGSVERRRDVLDELSECNLVDHHIIFIESECTDAQLLESNVRNIVRSPAYAGIDAEAAMADYKARIEMYRGVYERMEEETLSWMRLTNCGRAISANRVHGFLPGKIMQFLSALHTMPRSIYLTRHGQSEYNVLRKVGGDAGLSAKGEEYAVSLAGYVEEVVLAEDDHSRLWTSSLRRTRDTARHIAHPTLDGDGWVTMRPKQWRALDEIYAGIFDGMTCV